MNLKKVQNADLNGKTVLLRADLDVPIQNQKISDYSRLDSWYPTLGFLLAKAKKIIIVGHLGRQDSDPSSLSLEPVAKWLGDKLNSEIEIIKTDEFAGWKINDQVSLLENLRFHKGEEENNPVFTKNLSALADVYVNDAFASSHRKHASIVGVPKLIPGYAGLRFQKEVEVLSKVIENPLRPLTIIVGGAKIETKLPLISKMHQIAEFVLVGGEIAEHVKELAKVEHEKTENKKSRLLVADLTPDNKDIDKESTQRFKEVIAESKTIVWNGPMGEFEKFFDRGTREIANAIVNTSAHTIVGGGDTVAFLNQEAIVQKFSFVSTGGGAMLELLCGKTLPGLAVLSN